VYVEKDEFGVSKRFPKGGNYWYNPVSGHEQSGVPEFEEEWVVRRKRSDWIEDENGLQLYYGMSKLLTVIFMMKL
jgi:hypothetical protein